MRIVGDVGVVGSSLSTARGDIRSVTACGDVQRRRSCLNAASSFSLSCDTTGQCWPNIGRYGADLRRQVPSDHRDLQVAAWAKVTPGLRSARQHRLGISMRVELRARHLNDTRTRSPRSAMWGAANWNLPSRVQRRHAIVASHRVNLKAAAVALGHPALTTHVSIRWSVDVLAV